MTETKYIKDAAEIAVDTIDLIEKLSFQIVQDTRQRDLLIDKVVEIIASHYKTSPTQVEFVRRKSAFTN